MNKYPYKMFILFLYDTREQRDEAFYTFQIINHHCTNVYVQARQLDIKCMTIKFSYASSYNDYITSHQCGQYVMINYFGDNPELKTSNVGVRIRWGGYIPDDLGGLSESK